MPDIAPAATPASTTVPTGATPSVPSTPLPNPVLTLEQARAHMRQTSGEAPQSSGRDPLDDSAREVDPLQASTELPDPLDLSNPANAAAAEAVAALTGETLPTETTAETPAETPAEATELPQTPVEPEPPAPTAAETAAEEGRKRLNFRRKGADGKPIYNDRDVAVLNLMADEGIGIDEAKARLGYTEPQARAETTPPKAPEPPKPTVSDIETQIKQLRTERKSAADNLDTGKQNELSEKIEDLIVERFEAVRREERQQVEQRHALSAFDQAQEASIAEVSAVYPDAYKPGTPLNDAVQAEIRRMGEDPSFQSPDWPWLAARVAIKLGITPVSAAPKGAAPKPAPVPPKAQPSAPKARATPAPGSAGSSAPVVSPVEAIAQRMNDPKLTLREKAEASREFLRATTKPGARAA